MKKLYLSVALIPLLNLVAHAQQPFAIKPYAITLPRVTTAQQSSSATVPQQAGNMVYNTDQQAIAVNNGTGWGYLGVGDTGESGFNNSQVFNRLTSGIKSTWTVPAGVKQVLVEVWGAGAGGSFYRNLGTSGLTCRGGGAGGYRKQILTVTPGTSFTFDIGDGGVGASGNSSSPAQANTDGGNSYVYFPPASTSNYVLAAGGKAAFGTGGGTGGPSTGVVFFTQGQTGRQLTMSFEPRGGTDYVFNMRFGDGGIAFNYGAPSSGRGGQATFLNANALLYYVDAEHGAFPGGGGGCGYYNGYSGADGLVIIRW